MIALPHTTPPIVGAPSRKESSPMPRLATLMVVEAVTFIVGTILHTGIGLHLGPLALDEPTIVAAAIVEAICAVALLAGAATLIEPGGSDLVWAGVAHGVAIGGVLLGIVSLDLGAAPRTQFNDLYHVAVLTTLIIGAVVLARQSGRHASLVHVGPEHGAGTGGTGHG